MKIAIQILCYGLMLSLLGCASVEKAELVSGNPEKALEEVVQIMNRAEAEQVDLLANELYRSGKDHVGRAQDALAKGTKPESALDNAAIAKTYFLDANKQASPRRPFVERIMIARKAALDAGLRNDPSLVRELEEVDEDLRDDTDMFTESLSPKDFSKFQKEYLALEVKAVQFRELNDVEKRIKKANRQDAEDLAPKTLNDAMIDLEDARNIIEQSPRNPDIYTAGVQKSIESSILLADTMDVILNAKGTPEHIALKIVYQNRNLNQLSSNMMEKSEALKQQEKALLEKENALRSRTEQLQLAAIQVRFQEAMDDAREQLPESDALVYQQGTNLVFRLKRINFASGTATIPEASKPLLIKVDAIIKKLGAANVEVQGHTDSVGSDNLNQTLSTKRATSVANYLSSLQGGYPITYIGYGESKPIASNETAEGRAINRRVDLVVSAKKY